MHLQKKHSFGFQPCFGFSISIRLHGIIHAQVPYSCLILYFFRIIVYPFFPNENYNRFGYDMVWWMHKEMISYSLTALPCKMHGCLALLPQSQAVDEKMPLAQDTSWWLRWGPCVWQQWLIQCYISGEGWYSHHVYSDQHIKRIFEPSMAHPS